MSLPGSIPLVELDRRPFISCEYEDVDLSDFASITLRVRRPDGTLLEKAATIDNATEGLFHFEWASGDLTAGIHELEIAFVDTSGRTLTLPADAPLRGIVRRRV